jgi:hypothetical protein
VLKKPTRLLIRDEYKIKVDEWKYLSIYSLIFFVQERSSMKAGSKQSKIGKALLATFFHAAFLLGSFYDNEYGGDMFLRNIG